MQKYVLFIDGGGGGSGKERHGREQTLVIRGLTTVR